MSRGIDSCTAVITKMHLPGSAAERTCPYHSTTKSAGQPPAVLPLAPSSTQRGSTSLDGTTCGIADLEAAMEDSSFCGEDVLTVTGATIRCEGRNDQLDLITSLRLVDCVIEMHSPYESLYVEKGGYQDEEIDLSMQGCRIIANEGRGSLNLPSASSLVDVMSDVPITAPASSMTNVRAAREISVSSTSGNDGSAELVNVEAVGEEGIVRIRSCDYAKGIKAEIVSINNHYMDMEDVDPGELSVAEGARVYIEDFEARTMRRDGDHYIWSGDPEQSIRVAPESGPIVLLRKATVDHRIIFGSTEDSRRMMADIFTDRGDGFGSIDTDNLDALIAMNNLGGFDRDPEGPDIIVKVNRDVIPIVTMMHQNSER